MQTKIYKNKKFILPVLSVLTLVIIGFGFIVLSQEKEVEANNNSFTLVREDGDVQYKSQNDQEFDVLESEMDLPSGTSIKTGEESTAYVFFPDNSLVTIEPQTEITINVEENKINIDQIIGNTWHRVKTVTNGGEYNVKTPDTIASVRGTIFAVTADTDEGTNVYVIESKVDVDGSGLITANNYAQVKDKKEVKKEEISKETKETKWFSKNEQVDQIYEKNEENKEDKKEFKNNIIREIKKSEIGFKLTGRDKKEVLGKNDKKTEDKNSKEEKKIEKLESKTEVRDQESTDQNTRNSSDSDNQTADQPTPRKYLDSFSLVGTRQQNKLKLSWSEHNLTRSDRIYLKNLNTGGPLVQGDYISSGVGSLEVTDMPLSSYKYRICINDCREFSTDQNFRLDNYFSIEQVDGNGFKVTTPNGIATDDYIRAGYGFYFDVYSYDDAYSKKQPLPTGSQNWMNVAALVVQGNHKVKMCVYKDLNRNYQHDSNETCLAYSNTVDNVILY